LTDALFGRPKHSLEVLSEQDITMPEGKYPAHVKRERRTWKRPRWFTPLVREYWDVDVEGGIPVPGKGENSWDCDDDAIFASSFSVNNAETAYMAGKCVTMDALRPASVREPWLATGGVQIPLLPYLGKINPIS
jgi:hypothetical protein